MAYFACIEKNFFGRLRFTYVQAPTDHIDEMSGGYNDNYRTASDVLVLAQILLAGRIGLLNERGAELVIRKSTISSDTSLSESFREVQAVMAEISALIARAV
ncbi:MAG TPA: hypothetical protein VNL39_11635, partial [Xanthobacteraceae bacterium]|nr:hypothetical protein [Xanthobacteraceae bacterium]